MLKKIAISAVAATTLATAFPVTAVQAQSYGYYNGGRYEQSYRNGYYRDQYSRYQRDGRYYQNSRYNGDRYYGDSRYYRNGNRCSGTTGTIIGAIAGGLLGDAAVGRRGNDTAGAIIGAGVGALAGRAIDKSDCRR